MDASPAHEDLNGPNFRCQYRLWYRRFDSAARILLNHVRKDLWEIQQLLRHKNIRTTVRYTHVGYEQIRQTAKALSQALE